MLKLRLRRRPGAAHVEAVPLSLTYAIGDVHGCVDLLRGAFNLIRRHARSRPYQLVCLGDYIDRGPHSRAAVELLMSTRNQGRMVCLRGNHEEMLVRFALRGSAPAGALWMRQGGSATLASYGLQPDHLEGARQLPPGHLQWMLMRPSIYPTIDRIYVHAGIDPEQPLEAQGAREHLWIRERFLTADPDLFEERRHIVHGHTPLWAGKPAMETPELLMHRTNLDTGAYLTGRLAVGVFEPGIGPPVDVLIAG